MAPIASLEHFRVPPRWVFVKITDTSGNVGWGEATLEGHSDAVQGCLDAFAKKLTGQQAGFSGSDALPPVSPPQETAVEGREEGSQVKTTTAATATTTATTTGPGVAVTRERRRQAYDADDIEHIWQSLYRGGFYRGGPVLMSAIAGVDIALWDLKARKLGVPIYELLGGKVRDSVRVYSWVGSDRPSLAVLKTQVEERKAQGFTAVKMNATEDVGWLDSPAVLDQAVARVKLVKSLGVDCAVDFHGRLHKPMAKQLARLLEPLGPLFIEEPLLSDNPEAVASLSQVTTIPVALGERLYTRWDVKPFLASGAVDVLQPDISHCGGISELRRIAAMAEAYDVAVAPHCPIGPLALAACVQVDATTPNFAIQEMSVGIHYNRVAGGEDIHSYIRNADVWTVIGPEAEAEAKGEGRRPAGGGGGGGGHIATPTGSGLGVDVDEAMIRRKDRMGEPWVNGSYLGPGGEVREW